MLVSRIDPLKETPINGSVVSHTSTHLRISFEEKFEVQDGAWRLDVGRSDIIFHRMRTAISHFHHDTGALERANLSSTPDRELIFHGTHLRDVLLRSFSPDLTAKHAPLQDADDVDYISHETLDHKSRQSGDHGGAFKDDMRIQSWAKRFAEVNPVRVEGDPVLSGLNATQTRAMAMMIGEKISLVQGVCVWHACFIAGVDMTVIVASWDGKDKDYHRNRKTSQGTLLSSCCLTV